MTTLTICSDNKPNNDMPFGIWYRAKYVGEHNFRKDKTYIVQRVCLTINGYKDCVIYLESDHVSYDRFDIFKCDYELLEQVEEIVVK